MFGKLRNLFGGAPGKGAQETGNRPGGRAYRPAQPRSLKGGARKPRALSAASASMLEANARNQLSAPTAAEIACPNCGEPMLSGWGSTCGKCRPNLVSPKTFFGALPGALPGSLSGALPGSLPGRSPLMAGEGMSLGWLLVIRSIDRDKRGTLVELDTDKNVLSRGGLSSNAGDKVIMFDDTYMSNGHALVNRPATGARTDAFTIRDREDPPSANGTFVNSHKLTAGEVVRLSDGDIIKVGATELLFKSLLLPGAASPRR